MDYKQLEGCKIGGSVTEECLKNIEKGKLLFENWQKENQGKPFHQYYVNQVMVSYGLGKPQHALGLNVASTDEFYALGKKNRDFLISKGLTKDSICVDYGCGGLRHGIPLINFLEDGNYYGLDVTDEFYKLAIEEHGSRIKKGKHGFHVISPEILERIRRLRPDYVFSIGVIGHVPPFELNDYAESLLSIMDEHTICYVQAIVSDETCMIAGKDWAHSEQALLEVFRAFGGKLEIDMAWEEHRPGIMIPLRNTCYSVTRHE